MTTIRFEQDQGVGTIVLANPPANRIGSQFAVDLRAPDRTLTDGDAARAVAAIQARVAEVGGELRAG